MSAITSTYWTCDRCKTRDETGANGQPSHWSSVITVTPPLASPDADGWSDRTHLCLACRRALEAFLSGSPLATVVPTDE